MKIYVAKASPRCEAMLKCFSDSLVEIDLDEFWKDFPRDEAEYFLEKLIKSKIEGSK